MAALHWSIRLESNDGCVRRRVKFLAAFAARLGVGVGEAACAPAATSLIGDLFSGNPASYGPLDFHVGFARRIALSFALSGTIARSYGWRAAFYVAGIPGLICALAVLPVKEAQRGATETHKIGGRRRKGSPYRLVFATPTMRWLIVSGALHNFNMYAIAAFITPFLMRYHGADIRSANFTSMVAYGLFGVPGLILGGVVGDAVIKRQANGRLLVGALAILGSVPLIFLALGRTSGDILGFMILMGAGCALMYAYYSTVYATIQDVIEPSLRGTAMALYFFAMYVLGASLGPYGTGLVSDFYTTRAASAAGMTSLTHQALEPFRAEGLHSAMYIIPALGVLLTLVLFAAAGTVLDWPISTLIGPGDISGHSTAHGHWSFSTIYAGTIFCCAKS